MIKKTFCCVVISVIAFSTKAQNTKSTKKLEQLWFGYHTQLRLTGKWELSADFQLRTREDFVHNFSQNILRVGVSWLVNDLTKFTAGYAYSTLYATVSKIKISQPEHRPWQQFQWENIYGKKRLTQRFRLEERFRQKILNDSIAGDGYDFNFRARYNIGYEIALSKKGLVPKSYSLVLNEDINVNVGKEIVFNFFDQNRIFTGIKYQFDHHNNITVGYMNLFQQTPAGNKFIIINAIRFIYIKNVDLRKKANH